MLIHAMRKAVNDVKGVGTSPPTEDPKPAKGRQSKKTHCKRKKMQ